MHTYIPFLLQQPASCIDIVLGPGLDLCVTWMYFLIDQTRVSAVYNWLCNYCPSGRILSKRNLFNEITYCYFLIKNKTNISCTSLRKNQNVREMYCRLVTWTENFFLQHIHLFGQIMVLESFIQLYSLVRLPK